MPWIIDRDFQAEPGARPGTNLNAVGVAGPRGYRGDGAELKFRFRMKDDDGEVYYEGRCSSCDDERAFDPLEDFGTPNAGCTMIEYLVGGHWKLL